MGYFFWKEWGKINPFQKKIKICGILVDAEDKSEKKQKKEGRKNEKYKRLTLETRGN